MKNITRVLIVDDSRIFRSVVEQCLAGHDDIKVIGSVHNGKKALEFIRLHRPDLVTLDIQMPEMDGLSTLRAIEKINHDDRENPPIGIIMVSALTRKGADITIEALADGAFDFITKPAGRNEEENAGSLERQLVMKIRYFASRRLGGVTPESEEKPSAGEKTVARPASPVSSGVFRAIVMGVSTGGPKALTCLLPDLCSRIREPVFIVQHMPPTFTRSLAKNLDSRCSHRVIEAEDNETVKEGHVYIAPGGKHLLLRRRGRQVVTVVNEQPPQGGFRPSVNVLFQSAGTIYGPEVLALILTGMGNDGTKGCAAIKRQGGYVLAQDETSSVVWGMPGSAVAAGVVDEVVPLPELAEKIMKILLRAKG